MKSTCKCKKNSVINFLKEIAFIFTIAILFLFTWAATVDLRVSSIEKNQAAVEKIIGIRRK